jgi:uncharacterized protein
MSCPWRGGDGRNHARNARLLLALLCVCLFAGFAAAQDFPTLTGRVVDQAGVIPAGEKAELEQMLAAHEQKSSNQVVVATIASLGGETIEQYGVDLGRAWGIGQKGKNNGVILIVAPNERKVRIEVGYGLEGELTDAISSYIIQGSILPRFKAGDIPGGIRRGAEDIVAVLEGDAGAFAARAKARVNQEDSFSSATAVLIFMIAMFVLLSIFGRSRRSRYGGFIPPIIFGGGGGGGSSGGGFSGGGGSFGGGGASGSW